MADGLIPGYKWLHVYFDFPRFREAQSGDGGFLGRAGQLDAKCKAKMLQAEIARRETDDVLNPAPIPTNSQIVL